MRFQKSQPIEAAHAKPAKAPNKLTSDTAAAAARRRGLKAREAANPSRKEGSQPGNPAERQEAAERARGPPRTCSASRRSRSGRTGSIEPGKRRHEGGAQTETKPCNGAHRAPGVAEKQRNQQAGRHSAQPSQERRRFEATDGATGRAQSCGANGRERTGRAGEAGTNACCE